MEDGGEWLGRVVALGLHFDELFRGPGGFKRYEFLENSSLLKFSTCLEIFKNCKYFFPIFKINGLSLMHFHNISSFSEKYSFLW